MCVEYFFVCLILFPLSPMRVYACSVLMTPHDLSEAEVLYSLTSKAMFENNRYKKPKRETKSSSDYVDWM
jgi:hypothetical protein